MFRLAQRACRLRCSSQVSAIDGGTPLHFCTARGHLSCIRFLIDEALADVNERDNNGAIPLYFAAQEGYFDVVRYLVGKGADPLSRAHDGMCAVHAAAQAGKLDCLKFLIEHTDPRHALQSLRHVAHGAAARRSSRTMTARPRCTSARRGAMRTV